MENINEILRFIYFLAGFASFSAAVAIILIGGEDKQLVQIKSIQLLLMAIFFAVIRLGV